MCENLPTDWRRTVALHWQLRYQSFLHHPGENKALVVKNAPTNAGDIRDAGSIPASGRSSGEGNGNPLQNSRLENSMDRAAWWVTVPGVAKSQTPLRQLSTGTRTRTEGPQSARGS